MQMKYIAAAAALVLAGSAQAITTSLGTIDDSTVGVGNFVGGLPFFSDTFTFTLEGLSTITGTAGSSGFSNFTVLLIDPSLSTTFDTTPESFTFSNLSAGDYALQFIGFDAAPVAFYGANIVATPVPEPETYALMLAGLGMVGFMAARRRNNG